MALTRITKGVIKPNENYDTHNINSTGIITAIGFKGPFTGSSDIQSGILTATKIDLNGDIDVDGHTNLDNVSIAGVVTATTINATTFSGAISGTTGTFSGNVSIGGTLTYEDVTNIDAVGIITARDNIKVGSGVTITPSGGAYYAGILTATSFVGGLPITNGADNRVITASSASAIQGESSLTFDGTTLMNAGGTITAERGAIPSVEAKNSTTSSYARFYCSQTSGSGGYAAFQKLGTTSTAIGGANATQIWCTGDAPLVIGVNNGERLRIDANGWQSGHTAYQGVGINTFASWARTGGAIRAEVGYNAVTLDYMYFGTGTTHPVALRTNNTNALFIDNGQRVLLGHIVSQEVYGTNRFQIQGTSATTSGMSLLRHGGSPYLALGSTGGSAAGHVNAVADDSRLGQLTFVGADGTDVNTHAASIGAYVDGSVSSNTVPGRLVFSTSTGAGEPIRMVITSGGKVNIGGNYTQTSAPLSVTTGANSFGYRLLTGSNVVVDIMNNDAAGNSEIRGYYNNNSGTRGEGFRIESNGDTYFNPGGVTGLKIRANNGYVGAGKPTPGCALDVLNTADQLVARFLSNHTTLGGGVQVKNNNQRGGLEFLYKDGSNQGAFYHSTGGWTWDKELQLVGTAKLRIGTTSGNHLLNVDSGDGTDGHIIASFNGEESSNHAGLNIAHYLCGSDDNRTGLYWEHQNVSNERMWMGDDKRLYLKNSNPSESTAQGRYIMTVEGGSADYPDGSSYDNAAKSALEIKKHYPGAQSGNYWIYDYNGTPRQIRCDMEIDGGGWMLWHDHNVSNTSMNEALGGSASSPHSGLGRGNYSNYAYYQVLIRATKVGDSSREALHTIVQLDHNGNLFRKYDYGEEFLKEEVGNPYNPTLNQYFSSGDGEWIGNTQAYGGQCGSSGWTNFGTGTSTVYIREKDSRLSPGDHRSYAMHERVFCFNDNGVPMWRNAASMGVLPYWTDIRGQDNMADGAGLNSSGTQTDNMQDTGRTIYMNNGNNGDALHGRIHGVFLGEFEVAFRLSAWWGWAVGNMNAGIGVQESISDGQAWPYYLNTNYGYAGFGLMNNSSNNLWYPNHFYNGDTSQTIGNSGSGYSGGNSGWNIMWRTGDGTIKVRRQDNTHGTYTYGKFVGPLIFGNGYQSPAFTEMGVCWDKPWNTNGTCMR